MEEEEKQVMEVNLEEESEEELTLEQRVERLEDLILVEQAGITELKRVLQKYLEEFEKLKRKKIEEIKLAVQQSVKEEIDRSIEKQVPNIYGLLNQLSDKVAEFDSQIFSLNKQLKEVVLPELKRIDAKNTKKINEIVADVEEVKKSVIDDIEALKSKLGSMNEKQIKSLANKVHHLANEIENMKEKVEKISLLVEIKPLEKNVKIIKQKPFEKLEEVEEELAKELREKIGELEKEVKTIKQKPFEENKEVVENIKELVKRVELLSQRLERMDKELMVARNRITELQEKIEKAQIKPQKQQIDLEPLFEKIVELENKISALEAVWAEEKESKKPVVIE